MYFVLIFGVGLLDCTSNKFQPCSSPPHPPRPVSRPVSCAWSIPGVPAAREACRESRRVSLFCPGPFPETCRESRGVSMECPEKYRCAHPQKSPSQPMIFRETCGNPWSALPPSEKPAANHSRLSLASSREACSEYPWSTRIRRSLKSPAE